MQQLLSVWLSLDGQKRIVLSLSLVALLVTLIGLSRLATAPTMSLLYANLESGTAGEIVNTLEQRGVAFEIRGNAILVDSKQRDQLRLTLAAAGLPANDGQGYELLDTLTGFGTTAQMFDAAYWRAKEGELARTIVSGQQFRNARVHISNSPTKAFRRPVNPTASVTVTATSGAISNANAQALRYLVASAVAGMTPTDVSIIDGRNGVVVQDGDLANGAGGGSDKAAELKRSVERLLQARVGNGSAIVEVFVETANVSETISERTFDPDSRVAISTQKEERTTSSNDTRAGAVSVASNLPTGDAGASDNNSSSQNSETREQTNYEVSETNREIVRTPGSIVKISTAVLLDGVIETDPETNADVWTPRSQEELATLRELVASAVGFNEARGDVLSLKSMQFQTVETTGVAAQASFLQGLNFDMMRAIQLLVLASVSLVLGLFVLRPILAKSPVPALAGPQALHALPGVLPIAPAIPNPATAPQALTGEIEARDNPFPALPAVNALEFGANGPGATGAAPPDAVKRLRSIISERQGESVEILRNWVDGNEGRA